MTSSSLRRRIAVLLVSAFFLVSSVSAAGPCSTAEPMGFLTRLWSALISIWSAAGCSADPYGGGCPNGTGAPESPDEGCSADPYGRCLSGVEIPPPSPDEGCSIDPYGGCRSGG